MVSLSGGLFAGALGYLIATWVQAQTTAARAALVFTLEAPFAALFGVLLALVLGIKELNVLNNYVGRDFMTALESGGV